MHTIYYSEEQKVTNKWLWLLMATITVVYIYGFTEQLILKQPFGQNPAPDWFLAIIGLIPLSLLFLMSTIKFSVQINEEGINYRFYPFHLSDKKINWDDIASIYVRKYNPIREYGGWGIRTLSFTRNIAYNISGNDGLQIELKNGKKILFGTQNPEELEKYLSHLNKIKE